MQGRCGEALVLLAGLAKRRSLTDTRCSSSWLGGGGGLSGRVRRRGGATPPHSWRFVSKDPRLWQHMACNLSRFVSLWTDRSRPILHLHTTWRDPDVGAGAVQGMVILREGMTLLGFSWDEWERDTWILFCSEPWVCPYLCTLLLLRRFLGGL